MTGLEIITMGRISVDLYPEQIGVPLAEVKTFAKSLGGSATNVAVAAARLGHRSAVITRVGDDGFGAYIRAALERFGVNPRWVSIDPDLRTPLAFCEIFPPDNFPILFYRQPKAPDINISTEDLDLEAIEAVPLYWMTGTGLSDEPSRSTTLTALRQRSAGITVFDLDHRPMLWESREVTERWYREALQYVKVVVGNQEEVEVAVGTGDPFDASAALLDLGLDLAIVKRGPEGVLARTAEGVVEAQPIEVEIVNGLGAGDAFGGALCHGLLSGWDPETMIRYANAAGAIVASRLACADDMPSREEVEQLLERSAGV